MYVFPQQDINSKVLKNDLSIEICISNSKHVERKIKTET